MNGDQTTVACVVGAMVILLYSRRLAPTVIFIAAAAFLVLTGILTPAEALGGFANEAIAVMILLLVMSQMIWRTGFVQWIFGVLIKPSGSYGRFLCQMMPFTGISSAFMNNTPVVAMMIPFVGEWGRRHGVPASKLLMPLSWAAILGGMLTMIGTSTNMIVDSLVIEHGGEGLSILDFTPVGLMIFTAGMAYVLVVGRKTLPSRKNPYEKLEESPREYITDLVVDQGSRLAGKTVHEARLRGLKDLFLIEIIRGSTIIAPVKPEEVLEAGDRLLLAGRTTAVAELAENREGLSLGGNIQLPRGEKLLVVEVVVSNRSNLVNRPVKATNFRGKYDAAILGVHRQGKRVQGKIGHIVLQPGDHLLLLAGSDFSSATEGSEQFYVISRVKQIHRQDLGRSILITGSVFACIILGILNLVPLFTSLLLVLSLFLALKLTTPGELKNMVDLNILAVAAFALALGKAVHLTGLGEILAEHAVAALSDFGPVGVLTAVFLTTSILAELITTTAAATIVFPFAAASAAALGTDPLPFYLAVAYGAAANFVTPVGYQTNLMIFGPGGYTTTDYLKAGLPMKLVCSLSAVAGLALYYRL